MTNINSRIKIHITRLGQLYHGGGWLDESFQGKLKTINKADVFEAPVQGVHSIAEILWHCIYWRTVNIRRMMGDNQYRDDTIEKLNFLPLAKLKEKGWTVLKQELETSQQSLIKLLQDNSDSFLDAEYLPGLTHEHLIEGTIEHDAYHLGQIGLITKMLSLRDNLESAEKN